jgi:hypothetical protein
VAGQFFRQAVIFANRMTSENQTKTMSIEDYLEGRWKEQCDYFERKASFNQGRFILMRRTMLVSSWLTPIAIFILILIPDKYQNLYSILPLLLSTIAVGSYQWEELHNYGAQWSKFRLVAERLKGHRELFLQKAGPYRGLQDEPAKARFVEFCEGLIEGTDVSYFVLMVDPLRRKQEND